MKTNELSSQERIERRANWEAFSFGVCANGVVNIRNDSHNEPGHTYSVDPVAGRELVENRCSCNAAKYHEGPCKHQVAVHKNAAVMLAVEMTQGEGGPTAHTPDSVAQEAVATDGGQLVETDTETSDSGTEIIDAGDDGEILGTDGDHPAFTYHIEPPEQGGEEYARCIDCGYEILTEYGVDTLGHADGCSNENGGESR